MDWIKQEFVVNEEEFPEIDPELLAKVEEDLKAEMIRQEAEIIYYLMENHGKIFRPYER